MGFLGRIMSVKRVEGRTAFITGGARGIGEAIARLLSAEGARVILADLLVKEGEALAQKLNQEIGQGTAKFVKLDVTQESEWQKCATDFSDDNIDILVNNAGIFRSAPVLLTELAEWKEIFAINVEGVFLSCKHMLPLLQAQASKWKGGASIVNLSSMAGIIGAAGTAAYCASKGAVRLFTKALALECATEPLVRVNSVHPGIIDTMMAKSVAESAVSMGIDLEEVALSMSAAHPMNRLGLAEEIANGVLYLASGESSFSTGSELVMDGGFVAK